MRVSRGWREAAVFVALYEVFGTARSHIHPPAGPAVRHAIDVIRVERAVGLYQEGRLQRAVLDHKTVVQFWNIYYGTIHFVVPALGLWLLWRRRPERYARARTTFLVMCFGALVVFAVYPLAPPRYMPSRYGFVDTGVRFGGLGPLDSGSMKDTNPFAAMPSLHIGWSVWSAWVLVPLLARRPARMAAAVYPLVTLTAIVVTGNHWILDAAGGVAAFGAALALTTAGHRLRRRGRGGEGRVSGHDGRILGGFTRLPQGIRGGFTRLPQGIRAGLTRLPRGTRGAGEPPDRPPPPARRSPSLSSGLRRHRCGTDHLRP
ncbi:MAG: hypothetical protein QOJ23_1902 [Actinomycetota bacterium]|nr:hypothetical protein [Actinomycetota bacterium]